MNIDEVVLNLAPGTLVILNVLLGLIMLGIALDTSPEDFKVVLRHPKPFIIAILAQLLILPAVTFGPVSYTHLDVYKRQLPARRRSGNSARSCGG